MNKKVILSFVVVFLTFPLLAQQPSHSCTQQGSQQHSSCASCPHHGQHNKKQCAKQVGGVSVEIVRVFPSVKTVEKGKKFTEVYDANHRLLGYVAYSKPASDNVKGYGGETPLMVAFDLGKNIKSVTLLPNGETPGYLKRVTASGILDSWNGLSIKKAKKKSVDTISGATLSSHSIIETMRVLLESL